MTKKAVVFVFFDPKSKLFLVEKRKNNQFLSNLTVFPGGKAEDIDQGDLLLTLKREIEEELGVKSFKFVFLGHKVKGINGYWLYPFIISSWSGNIPNRSIDKGNHLEWIKLEEFKTQVKPILNIKKLLIKYIMSHNVIDTL